MFHFTKKLSSNTPPPQSTLLNHKIIILLSLLLLITVISISLFICSSCAISSTNYQDNQDSTIINYEIKSKETSIPPAAETYATNYVNWCLYSDGALVINGNNADPYNGHSSIKAKGTIDLNTSYYWSRVSGPVIPWYDRRSSIQTVEFARTTQPQSMSYWFYGCSNLIKFVSTNLDTSQVKRMDYAFATGVYNSRTKTYTSKLQSIDLSKFDTASVTTMFSMFHGCSKLESIYGLSNWNVSSVTTMQHMFYNCSKLQSIDLSDWNVSSCTIMSNMFSGCSSLTRLNGISDWDTSQVKYMSCMFKDTYELRVSDSSLSLSHWDVSSVTDMSGMFSSAYWISDIISDLSDWDVSSVTDMSDMFWGSALSCISKDVDLSDWDVSSVTDMSGMFISTAARSLDLSDWDVSSVTNMEVMFSIAGINELYLNNWCPKDNVNTNQMFYSTGITTIYCKNSWSPKSNDSMFSDCINLKSNTTGKTYRNGYGSSMANPETGLFTIPILGSFIPTIQKTILDENNHPISNWPFESGQFSFIISSDDPAAPLPEQTEVQTDDNGQAIWSENKYYDPGEYIYKIQEVPSDIPGITYDILPHELKVTIKEE